jgi:FG-GAP repeat
MRGRASITVAAVSLALLVPAAGRPGHAGDRALDVPRDAVATIVGPVFAPGFSRSTVVESAGDVNRDGKPDLLFRNVQGHGGDATRQYVLYGGRWPSVVRLPIAGALGFRVRGAGAAAAGDVNGDRYADLVSCTGNEATVLFGRPGRRAPVDRGLRVSAGCPERAGDIDGDGRDDLLLQTQSTPHVVAGVVFGCRPPAVVDARRPGRGGFRLEVHGRPFARVAPVGDLNGDGREEFVVDEAPRSPRLTIVFGRRRSGTVDSRRPGLPAIVGAGILRGTIASAGDVNGDGVDDLVIGIRGRRACVILGRRGRWPATTACGGAQSIVVDGAPPESDLGFAAGTLGDLDGDGYGDLYVSAPGEQVPGADFGGGAVYLVYGRADARRINLGTDARVIRIRAARDLGDTIGFSVTGLGDLTGDGVNDVVLGGSQLGDGWVVSPRTP